MVSGCGPNYANVQVKHIVALSGVAPSHVSVTKYSKERMF